MKLILYSFVALAAQTTELWAQAVSDLRSSICQGSQAKLIVAMPATVGGSTVFIPMCVTLGQGLRLRSDAAGGPVIESTSAPPVMRQMYEEIKLDAVPLDRVAIDHVLSTAPAPGTFIQVYYRGATFWTMQFDVLRAAGRNITIHLPYGRMAQTGDVVKLLYWVPDTPPDASAVRPQ